MQILYPSLNMNGNLQYGNNPQYIIWHHPEFDGTPEALNDMMISMGFVMAGYNYYIRKDGSVYAMRPVQAISGNCYNYNAKSIGIAFEGNFMTDIMGDVQFQAGVELSQYLMSQYPAITECGPHKKYYNTDCPGDNFPIDKMLSAVSGGTSTVTVTATPLVNTQEYVLWNSGSGVQQLQQKLITLGYDLGSSGADGSFGQATFNAIKSFQSSNGLTSDGIAGPKTLQSIDSAISAKVPATQPVQSGLVAIQHNLNRVMNAGLTEDGVAGTNTTNAISKFQGMIGLTIDGIAGPRTSDALTQILSFPVCTVGTQYYYAVRYIQYRLAVSIDGVYGTGTKTAVATYQSSHNLASDGICGANTWKVLFS